MSTRILIAEDDPFLAKLFTMNLSREGWDLHIVDNGQQAIEALATNPPNILLLDLIMPVVDGYGVLSFISKQNLKLPVIVLSNLNQETDAKTAARLGATDLMIKSTLDFDDLAARIERYTQPKI